jgi:uncharacterized metal-binding protein YceD (DUF177 family)
VSAPEFSRPVGIDTLGEGERRMAIEAGESERSALARRFCLVAIDRLSAEFALSRRGEEVTMAGALSAAVTQSCVATGMPLEAALEEPFEIVFRPQPEPAGGDEEVELDDSEMDVVFYDGAAVDAGEAVAETLLLNLDPYPRAPDADAALEAAGVKSEEEAGPFAALAGLKDKLKGGK